MRKMPDAPFGLRLPPELRVWVKMKAQMEYRSQNSLLISIVRDAMQSDNEKGRQGNPSDLQPPSKKAVK